MRRFTEWRGDDTSRLSERTGGCNKAHTEGPQDNTDQAARAHERAHGKSAAMMVMNRADAAGCGL